MGGAWPAAGKQCCSWLVWLCLANDCMFLLLHFVLSQWHSSSDASVPHKALSECKPTWLGAHQGCCDAPALIVIPRCHALPLLMYAAAAAGQDSS